MKKGTHHSDKVKQRISKNKKGKSTWMKGKHHTEETKQKISEAKKGKHSSFKTEFGKGNIPWNKGRKGLQEVWNKGMKGLQIGYKFKKGNIPWNKEKKSPQTSGKKNGNWLGGKSFEPYGITFNEQLKEQIRKRDGHRCQECFRHQDELFTKTGKKRKLSVHHIDYCKQNNNLNNLIALCLNCHLQTNYKRSDWTKYFKIKFYGNKTNQTQCC